MHSHKLVLVKDPSGAEWVLEWDDANFRLKSPEGEVLIDAPTAEAHRLVEPHELYSGGKISFATREGPLTFKPQKAAVADLRRYLDVRLLADTEYSSALAQQSRVAIFRGLAMFLVGGLLFALFCWWASWAPEPPPGHWLRAIGGLIHPVLLLLLATTLAGPCVCLYGLKQLRRLRRIEKSPRNGA